MNKEEVGDFTIESLCLPLQIYLSMIQAFKTILKTEGSFAYFRGLAPSLILVAPQAGVMFTSHNMLMSLLDRFSMYG